jgi:hypothetical protein
MTTAKRNTGVVAKGLASIAAALALLAIPAAPASAASFGSTGSLVTPRYKAAAAPLPGGDVLVVGGLHNVSPSSLESESLASAEVYGDATGSFAVTGSMAVSRMDPTAAPLPDGRVLVVGGQIWGGGGTPLASAEIYDPETGEFSPTGSMAEPRFGAMAALLPDGTVLVAGGYGNGKLASAEIYDPETGEFSATASMNSARAMGTAAPLPNGTILVAARGSSPGNILETEIYDSSTGTFAAAAELPKPLTGSGAALEDGSVLMLGEMTRSETFSLKLLEEYDPVAESFSSPALEAPAVSRPAVAALPGNRVLVAGGYSDEGLGIVGSAVVYDKYASPAAGDAAVTAAATASSAPAASAAPQPKSSPAIGTSRSMRTCTRPAQVGKRHVVRHARAKCAKAAAKTHPAARHRS